MFTARYGLVNFLFYVRTMAQLSAVLPLWRLGFDPRLDRVKFVGEEVAL